MCSKRLFHLLVLLVLAGFVVTFASCLFCPCPYDEAQARKVFFFGQRAGFSCHSDARRINQFLNNELSSQL